MRNVKIYTRGGRVYHYHRPTGIRLPGEPGSPEFQEEYERLEGRAAEARAVQLAKLTTLGELFAAYRASPAFREKAESTRADYQEAMDWLKPLGDMPITLIDTPFVTKLRDRAYEDRKRWFANHLLRFLSMLWNWGKPYGHTTLNVVEGVPKIRRPRGAREVNRPWTARELAIVTEALPVNLQVALGLGAFAGLREGDTISIQWGKFDGDVIESRQLKTGDPIWVPTHRDLRAMLQQEKARRGILEEHRFQTIVVGQRGAPYTGSGFRACFFRVIRALVTEGRIDPGLTFHGLRHTAATMLADAGCDTRDIMAITGHKTEAMVARYARGADQKRRATGAIVKLEAFTARTKNNAQK